MSSLSCPRPRPGPEKFGSIVTGTFDQFCHALFCFVDDIWLMSSCIC